MDSIRYKVLEHTCRIQLNYIKDNNDNFLYLILDALSDIIGDEQGVIAMITNKSVIPMASIKKKYITVSVNSNAPTRKKIREFLKGNSCVDHTYIPVQDISDTYSVDRAIGLISMNKLNKINANISVLYEKIEPLAVICSILLKKESIHHRMNLEKGTILSYVGHEMKTSLTNSVGYTKLLRYSRSSMNQDECIDRIEQANMDLISIVNNTIDYSMLLLNKIKLKPVNCDINECVKQSIAIVSNMAKQCNMRLMYNIDKSLIHSTSLDSIRFKQLLISALTSIVNIMNDYDANGSVLQIYCIRLLMDHTDKLCVKISLNNKSTLKISDMRLRLSDKLKMPDKGDKIYEGIDLNMQIAKKLSNLFEGNIEVGDKKYSILCIYLIKLQKLRIQMETQELMHGKHFIILSNNEDLRIAIYSYLEDINVRCNPLSTIKELGYFIKRAKRNDEPFILLTDMDVSDFDQTIIRIDDWMIDQIDDTDFISKTIINVLNKDKPTTKILIVEDNKSNRLIISSFLDILGWTNHDEVSNGQQAIDNLKKTYYDLVFMDINMPVLDGISAFEQLVDIFKHKDEERPYVIALSAFLSEAAISADMDDYISKPITNIIQLEDALQKYFRIKQIC